jgi:S-disulfanyl-L-cysteine oxidoreductase SoxD
MCISRKAGLLFWLIAGLANCAIAQARYEGIGRPALPEEIKAWNIDVRPDFKGLPKGKGTVAQGEKIWEAKCTSCHGVFGESNSAFNPIIGGTKASDIASGHVASLRDDYPGRSTLMKLSQLSTLWDYIRRAMPWNAPKTLSADEVYAVTAYVLHLGDVLSADASLSDANMAEVQAKLPNRFGMTTQHPLWPGDEFKSPRLPDVQGSICMKDCAKEVKVVSALPAHARDAHGNLADQNRLVGVQLGAYTISSNSQMVNINNGNTDISGGSIQKMMSQYACASCHALAQTIVGPSFKAIAAKYSTRPNAAAYLAGKIRNGSNGVWGQIPMPPQALNEADATAIAQWLLAQP